MEPSAPSPPLALPSSEMSTRGQSESGLEGSDEDDVDVEATMASEGREGGAFSNALRACRQATVATCSGSGDQQLSLNQQPMTTVTRPISSASIMYTSALPKHVSRHELIMGALRELQSARKLLTE